MVPVDGAVKVSAHSADSLGSKQVGLWPLNELSKAPTSLRTTCSVKWAINVTQNIQDFAIPSPVETAVTLQASRTSPQIDLARKILYFGTQTHAPMRSWQPYKTHPHVVIKNGGTLVDDTMCTGISSAEENAALSVSGGWDCCSFIGADVEVRFDAHKNSFTIFWSVPTLPADDPSIPGSWSGAGAWGSQPPVDLKRKQVFFATGNLYTVPDAYLPCIDISLNLGTDPSKCFPERVWQKDGENCDFGMAPSFIPGASPHGKDMLVVGQKGGMLYGLDEWNTTVGPGNAAAGMSWGVAADAKYGYFTEKTPAPLNQSSNVMPTLVGDLVTTGRANRTVPNGHPGGLLALDKATGNQLFHLNLEAELRCMASTFSFGTGYRNLVNGLLYVLSVDA
ncbi:Quino protein alcohol dehydrogenase-like protein [Diplogelasinospora grovesii]|uniref:Quino protein alcohol dehydrogenase-like protein n=1 Tax=Diplogelasinospora grovesii TaxID=303347 RepID=A0AAN6N8E8_9PEZI|nr:Quino protein alcohol dehydrogenase-like protein [Diplogelasinospora grovesii]